MSTTTKASRIYPTRTNGSPDTLRRLASDATDQYLKTPYVHQGRAPGRGLDCIGLIVAAYQTVGVTFDLPLAYTMSPRPRILLAQLARYCDPVDKALPGDIALMNLRLYPQHLAIFNDGDTITHSYRAAGEVVRQQISARDRKQIKQIYRVKDGLFIQR